MNWDKTIENYRSYLKLEKSLSSNSVEAYISDVKKLTNFFATKKLNLSPDKVELSHLKDFVATIPKNKIRKKMMERLICRGL